MKKLVHLHIGTHKTGTTVLQQTLAENPQTLAQQGYLYPRAGWHQYAQHFLAFEKKGSVNTGMTFEGETAWSDLRQEIDQFDGNNIIISSEEFSTLTAPDKIIELKEELKNYDIRVYIYLRRQDAIFESIYNQQTKDWLSPRIESIEECIACPEIIYPLFDYYAFLTRWASIFGKEHLAVRNYSELRQKNISTVDDFLVLAGIDAYAIVAPSEPVENKSISRRAMEMVRLSKLAGLTDDQRQRIFELALSFFPGSDGGLLNSRQREEILRRYKKSNKKLKEFGVIFDTNTKACPPPGKELTSLEIVRMLGNL